MSLCFLLSCTMMFKVISILRACSVLYTLLILRDKFFAFGSTKTYSWVVKFALSRCSLVIFVLHKVNIIPWYIYKQLGSISKQSKPHTFSSILPICINTHGQYTTPTCTKMCIQNIGDFFFFLWVFEFALADFCVKFAKINVPRILLHLQYKAGFQNTWCTFSRKFFWSTFLAWISRPILRGKEKQTNAHTHTGHARTHTHTHTRMRWFLGNQRFGSETGDMNFTPLSRCVFIRCPQKHCNK